MVNLCSLKKAKKNSPDVKSKSEIWPYNIYDAHWEDMPPVLSQGLVIDSRQLPVWRQTAEALNQKGYAFKVVVPDRRERRMLKGGFPEPVKVRLNPWFQDPGAIEPFVKVALPAGEYFSQLQQ